MTRPKVMGTWKPDESDRADTGPTVRGKPISSPIPFPENDEFPFRTHGPSISISREPGDIEKQLLDEKPASLEPESLLAEDEKDYPTETRSIESLAEAAPQPTYAPPPPAPPPVLPPAPSTSQPSHVRISSATISSNATAERPKRRKSTLRSVFGKLFGRKNKESRPSTIPEEGSADVRAGLHRSDPTPFKGISKKGNPSQQRSVSLPINELDRALRPHSTSTEDFRFPLTPNLNRSSGIQDGKLKDGDEKPRRATLSGVWSPGRVPGHSDWTGLSPRPASSHARGSKVSAEEENEGAVGIAVTSGSHPKRRSRSAGELRALTTTGLSLVKPWGEGERRAMLPLTPTIIEIDHPSAPVLTPSTLEDRSPIVPLTPFVKEPVEEPVLPTEEDPAEDHVPESPKPFSFGPMIEMARKTMIQNNTLQERMQKLEARMNEMEKTLNRLDSQELAGQLAEQDVSSKDRSPSSSRPKTGNSELSLPGQQRLREPQLPHASEGLTSQASGKPSSFDSRRPSTISTNTSYQPSDNEPLTQSLTSADQKSFIHPSNTRPLSNSTTIRGFPGTPPTFPNDGNISEGNYTSLLNMILAEREARQELELVVLKLQQRLQTIAWTSSPASGSNLANAAGEVRDDGQFLDLDQDDSSIDDGQYTNEEYRTPNADAGPFGDEIFGSSATHKKTATKTAPRVVSLSQMTLGRGAQPSLGF